MILYALIIRTKDGLALSATTDFNDEINKNIKSSKRYVKLVVKKINSLADRCTLNLGQHSLYLIASLGVAYFVLCDASYPSVLAFSFLSELNREFITKYDRTQIEAAKRPYFFIEFDNYIHRARQRYNKPQSLTTKVNLSELSTELKLRPAYKISLSEIESVSNKNLRLNDAFKLEAIVAPKLRKLSSYAYVMLAISVIISLLEFIRGMSAIHSSSFLGQFDGPSPAHGVFFCLESLFRMAQCYILVLYLRRRMLCAWMCFGVIVFLNWILLDTRDKWQTALYICVAVAHHVCCLKQQVRIKLPDYTV